MISPRRPGVRIRFNMKLEPVGPASKPECLVRVHWTRRQQHGAIRQCECIAVPMEGRQVLAQPGEERILPSRFGEFYQTEADFRPMPWIDFGAKRPCQQLRSKTDAEHGNAATSNCRQQFAFFAEKWVLVFFISAPGTAHHYQAVHVIRRGNLISTIEPSDIDFATALFSLASNNSRSFPLDML